jgi:hypothetical protein
MPRQKIRNRKIMAVDVALYVKLSQFRKLWEATLGEPISEIEMTKIFGEYAKIDIRMVKQMRDKDG